MTIISTEVRTIGPREATDLLRMNYQNRALNKQRVIKYARDMEMGAWRETGQGLTIYREPTKPHNEYLQDGQTRLYAVVESGTTQRFLVVKVDEPVYDVIDIGQQRSLQQLIQIHFRGQGNSGWLGVVAGAMSVASVLVPQGTQAYRNDSKAARVQRLAEDFDAATDALPLIREGYQHCGKVTGPVGHIAAFLSLREELGTEQVSPFFTRIARGEGLVIGQPEYAQREALLTRQFALTRGESSHLAWYESTIRAWNAATRGERMTTARVEGTIPAIAIPGGPVSLHGRRRGSGEAVAATGRG